MACRVDLGAAAFGVAAFFGLRLEVVLTPHPILRVHCSP
jgi:hypothetical protein